MTEAAPLRLKNDEIVKRALDVLGRVGDRFISVRLAGVLAAGTTWVDALRAFDQSKGRSNARYSPTDPACVLRMLTDAGGMPPQMRVLDAAERDAFKAYASELRNTRNQQAHGVEFSDLDTIRAIDTATRLAIGLGATDDERRELADLASFVAATPMAPRGLAEVNPSAAGDHTPSSPVIVADEPAADSGVRIEASVLPFVSFPLVASGFPVVNRVTVRNERGMTLEAELRITVVGPLGPLSFPTLKSLRLPNGTTAFGSDEIEVRFDPQAIYDLDTVVPGYVRVEVLGAAGVLAKVEELIDVRAPSQWWWDSRVPATVNWALIGPHVMPNDPAVGELVADATHLLGQLTDRAAWDGYQADDPTRVDAMARALFTAAYRRGIAYAEPPASWDISGQAVRTPSGVLTGRIATCLDSTVTLAAALETVGIRPIVVMVPGHAFLAYWRRDRSEAHFDEPIETDRQALQAHHAHGNLGFVETTFVTGGPDAPMTPWDEIGRRDWIDFINTDDADRRIEAAIDVQELRFRGVRAIPARSRDASGQTVLTEYNAALSIVPERLVGLSTGRVPMAASEPPRVTMWKNALLDLSLRNRLLNFGETPRTAINVFAPTSMLGRVEDFVSAGQRIALAPGRQKEAEEDIRAGVRAASAINEDALRLELEANKTLLTNLTPETYLTRLRYVSYQARTIEQETGANNLYLVFGMLRWAVGGKSIRSPLVLVPIRLETSGRGQQYRIVLDETGESTPNYSLIEKLRQEFGLTIPELSQPPVDESGIALDTVFDATDRAIARVDANFHVERSLDFGILQFGKFRLWKDLDEHWSELATNPLVKHLIETPTMPFVDPVTNAEAVDLDALNASLPIGADSSQVDAVAAAVAGKTFILEGPPGTGKSQTITNLLAHAIASGKRVLFVAQKLEALRVVQKRLQDAGLGVFALEAHDKSSSAAVVRARILAALNATSAYSQDAVRIAQEGLDAAGGVLQRYAQRLHERNGADLSLYRAHLLELLGADENADVTPLDVPEALVALGEDDDFAKLASALRGLPEAAGSLRFGSQAAWRFLDEPPLEDLGGVRDAAIEFDALAAALEADPAVTGLLAAASTPEDLDTVARLTAAPRTTLDVIDAAAGPSWRSEAASAITAVERFVERFATSAPASIPTGFELEPASTSVPAGAAPVGSDTPARILRRPPFSGDVLDAAATADWRSRAQAVIAAAEAFRATLGPTVIELAPSALSIDAVSLLAAAHAADAAPFFKRKKARFAVLGSLAGHVLPGVVVKPKVVTPLVERLASARAAAAALMAQIAAVPGLAATPEWNPLVAEHVESLRLTRDWLAWLADARSAAAEVRTRIDAVPGLSVREEWSPLVPDEVQALRLTRDWLAWLGGVAGGHAARSALGAAARQFMSAGIHAREATGSTALAAAAGLRALVTAARVGDGGLADWVGAGGIVPTWSAGRAMRGSGAAIERSLGAWNRVLTQLEPLRLAGLAAARRQILDGEVAADDAAIAFQRGIAVASRAERIESTGLGDFDETSHRKSVERYSRNLTALRGYAPTLLPARIIEARTFDSQSTMGQVGTLRRELERQRGGMSVRALFDRYIDVITQITPCVMLGPESVARFLPARAGHFDIVVFDEASQIRVADAVGAMGRGQSVVVVGDSQQMPPTSFAESFGGGEIEVAVEGTDEVEVVADQESILTECAAARVPSRSLTWHYRSQDESLIAFSNRHYYDGALASFPTPNHGRRNDDVTGYGISLRRVDGRYTAATGPRDLQQTNSIEADAVVAEVVRRFAASPSKSPSLGIVTFNKNQRALIERRLRDLQDPRIVDSLQDDDGLFVKNLEYVQGDERDTILFSIGRSADVRGTVPLNFGPLNLHRGERRLNVAITRARRQVIMFCSFDPEDLRVDETQSVGVKHLGAYLAMAERGSLDRDEHDRRIVDDRHRDEIADALRRRGFSTSTDVGLSEFRVDITVAPPGSPQPVAAVLLDGEGWAGRRTIADRDALPADVLVGAMHWPLVARVWLPEWLSDPEGVLDRLEREIEGAARRAAPSEADEPQPVEIELHAPLTAPQSSGSVQPTPVAAASTATQSERTAFVPWQSRHVAGTWVLDELPRRDAATRVAAVLKEIVEAEGPIHFDRLAKLAAGAFDLERVAQARVDAILRCLPAEHRKTSDEPFAWPTPIDPERWAEYRPDLTYARPVEQISSREYANAMVDLCRRHMGIERDELTRAVLNLFGGRRVTEGIGAVLDHAVERAIASGRIVDDGSGFLKPGQ